jgi:hypothetical protein
MTLLLRRGQLAGRGVVAAVPPPLLRPRQRRVVRALVPLAVARGRLVRKPAAAVPQRRLERLRRAGLVVLAARALVPAAVLAVVPVWEVPAVPAEDQPLGLRLWPPRVGAYRLEGLLVGHAGHLREPALAAQWCGLRRCGAEDGFPHWV